MQYYVASSLDGFVADDKDSVDFLGEQEPPPATKYDAFIAGVGAVVMGSASYEFIVRHMATGREWPYAQPAWVFTTRTLQAPAGADVRFVRGRVADVHSDVLAAAGQKHVWLLGGGDLAGQYHDAGLLDEIVCTVASVTLGDGKPLLPRRINMELVEATPLGTGFVELRYRVKKPV